MLAAAVSEGLGTVAEVFADRAYEADGSLAKRDRPGAVLSDPGVVVARALRMIREHLVDAMDGTPVHLVADTMCLHSDTPGAAVLARALRSGLEAAGVTISAPRAPRGGPGAALSR